MHFLRTLILLIFCGSAFSTPTHVINEHEQGSKDLQKRDEYKVKHALDVRHNLEERQGPLVIAALVLRIAEGIISIGLDIWNLIQDINDRQHQAESDFTRSMTVQLRQQYPYYNVLVFHNQDSQYQFYGAAHQHYELGLPWSFGTRGYEVWVFDYGTFHLAGDGGFINWCFSGNYIKYADGWVQFNTVTNPNQVKTTMKLTNAPTSAPPLQLPPSKPQRVSHNSTDGNYFVNCKNRVDGTNSSGVAYYASLIPGKNVGQIPTDYQEVTHGSYAQWEHADSVAFSDTGAEIAWSIFGNAPQADTNCTVGTASSPGEHFWVYKDHGEFLYAKGDWDCNSMYWAY